MAPNSETEKPTERVKGKNSDTEADDEESRGRPGIAPYKGNKFQVGDEVWLTKSGTRELQGPYLISGMASPGKYTLCLKNGTPIENGAGFDEKLLDFVD